MSEHGGYRKPRTPAPVSGPGKHSRRTDGGPGVTFKQAQRYIQGDEYGESTELNDLAASADLAAAPPPASAQVQEGTVTGNPQLHEPTGRPDEAVTAGVGSLPIRDSLDPEVLADAVRKAYVARPSTATRKLLEAIEEMGL